MTILNIPAAATTAGKNYTQMLLLFYLLLFLIVAVSVEKFHKGVWRISSRVVEKFQ